MIAPLVVDEIIDHIGRTRVDIFQRYNELRELRNRVFPRFHVEPAWNRTILVQRYVGIPEAIRGINPTLHRAVLLLDRFPEVYQNERSRIEQKLTNEFHPP